MSIPTCATTGSRSAASIPAGISTACGCHSLSVALDVTITGLDQATAEAIVAEAHEVCPYSNAVKGNIDVAITVTTN
jgi:organic hydroperoxide reductase OsmC/OhrA